jgi:restriction system protein
MAIWLIRAGPHGEYESKFTKENRVYVTWSKLAVDLSKLAAREDLAPEIFKRYPEAKPKTIPNWAIQVWPFAHEIRKGDLVAIPLKSQPAVQFGEVTGDYRFEPDGPAPFFHWRSVKWIGDPVPRTHFSPDLLYTFGACLTICRVQRNNAEARITAMREAGWKPEPAAATVTAPTPPGMELMENPDLDELARDQIVRLVEARFKGHALGRLVEAILKAQGYTTYRSAEGADGGVDILAGAGPLGFGSPRLCVQIRSQDTPVGRPEVDPLLGAMKRAHATEGLFVSWSGFKANLAKELSPNFFAIRLWTQKELLEQLFAHYDHLDEDLKAELPLKRIWTVAAQEDG